MFGEQRFTQPSQEHAAPEEKKPFKQLVIDHLEAIPKAAKLDMSALVGTLSLRKGGNLPPHMQEDSRALLREMSEKYGVEAVWDAFITNGTPASDILYITQRSNELDAAGSQNDHSYYIDKAERGYDESPLSFGFVEPTYHNAVADRLQDLQEQSTLNTLLLGAMAHQTADEFGNFSHELNPRAMAIAIDIETEELQYANRGVVQPVRADAAALPFATGSQDLVFTNFLTPFLRENCLPTGAKTMAMLRESNRVLREGGRAVFAEKTPSLERSNIHSWIAKLLLEESVTEAGFKLRPAQPLMHYTDHVEKKLGLDLGDIEEDVTEFSSHEPAVFAYVVTGEK
jgi:ubiquinone/menaquinone biosynthesis C-methylase UbiE